MEKAEGDFPLNPIREPPPEYREIRESLKTKIKKFHRKIQYLKRHESFQVDEDDQSM